MLIKRALKYGYCSGVRVADLKVRRFAKSGKRGAILGQVVHNERVVSEMEALGMCTVNSIEEATEPTIVFSAHGVPPSFHERAKTTGLEVLDTTCTFVYDIHNESREALIAGFHLVFIGEPDHREVVGYTNDLAVGAYHVVTTLEQAESINWGKFSGVRIFYQTTLNADDFEGIVSVIESGCGDVKRADTICYATRENQEAARNLAEDPKINIVLVIGGTASANTRHLWEITSRIKPSYLIQDTRDIHESWFEGVDGVGITAGASTPDALVDEVEEWIVAFRSKEIE